MEGLRAAGGRVLVGGWTALVPPSGVPPSKIADPSPGNSMGPEGRLHWETKRGTWDQDFANLGQCCKSCQSWAGRQWAKILLILLFCLPVWGARLQVRLLILQSCNLASVHDGGEGRVLKSCNPAPLAPLASFHEENWCKWPKSLKWRKRFKWWSERSKRCKISRLRSPPPHRAH